MISKSLFSSFIEKYYLTGRTETAKISIKDNVMKCNFQGGDASLNVLGTIILNDIDLPDGELNLFESTSKILKLFTALDDQIEIKYIKGQTVVGDEIKNIELIDSTKTINFTLADSTLLDDPKKMTKKLIYDIEFDLTDSFINEYLRSKAALSEAIEFGLRPDKKGAGIEIVINYSSNNVNNIVIPVAVTKMGTIDTLIFDANILRDILTANKNIPGKIEVLAQGMLKISFESAVFKNEYYLLGKKA